MNGFVSDISEDDFIATITSWRGSIIYDYANVEFLLAKLIMYCSNKTEYADFMPLLFPYSAEKRLKTLRQLVIRKGPLENISEDLQSLLDKFDELRPLRHMMVHSMMTYQYDAQAPVLSTITFLRYDIIENGELACLRGVFAFQSMSYKQAETAKFGNDGVQMLTKFFASNDDSQTQVREDEGQARR